MSAPTPEFVKEEFARLLRLIPDIGKRYKYLYQSGYQRGRRQVVADIVTMSPVADDGTPLGVGGVFTSTRRSRDLLERAGKSVIRAHEQLKGAVTALNELQELIDMGHHEPAGSEDKLYPRTVTSAELRRVRKTQAKRVTAIKEGRGSLPWTNQDEVG